MTIKIFGLNILYFNRNRVKQGKLLHKPSPNTHTQTITHPTLQIHINNKTSNTIFLDQTTNRLDSKMKVSTRVNNCRFITSDKSSLPKSKRLTETKDLREVRDCDLPHTSPDLYQYARNPDCHYVIALIAPAFLILDHGPE